MNSIAKFIVLLIALKATPAFSQGNIQLYIVPFPSANSSNLDGSGRNESSSLPVPSIDVNQSNTFTYEIWAECLNCTENTASSIAFPDRGLRQIDLTFSLNLYSSNQPSTNTKMDIIPNELSFLNPITEDQSGFETQKSRVHECYKVEGNVISTSITKKEIKRSMQLTYDPTNCPRQEVVYNKTLGPFMRLVSFDVNFSGTGMVVASLKRTGTSQITEFMNKVSDWPSVASHKIERFNAAECRIYTDRRKVIGWYNSMYSLNPAFSGLSQNVSIYSNRIFSVPPTYELTVEDKNCTSSNCNFTSTKPSFTYETLTEGNRTIKYKARMISANGNSYDCTTASTETIRRPDFTIWPVTSNEHPYMDITVKIKEILTPQNYNTSKAFSPTAMGPVYIELRNRLTNKTVGRRAYRIPVQGELRESVSLPIDDSYRTGDLEALIHVSILGTLYSGSMFLGPLPNTPPWKDPSTDPRKPSSNFVGATCDGTMNTGNVTSVNGPQIRNITYSHPSSPASNDVAEIRLMDQTRGTEFTLINRSNAYSVSVPFDRTVNFSGYKVVSKAGGVKVCNKPFQVTYNPPSSDISCAMRLYRIPVESSPTGNISENWINAGWGQNENRTSSTVLPRRYANPNSKVLASMSLYSSSGTEIKDEALENYLASNNANISIRVQGWNGQNHTVIVKDSLSAFITIDPSYVNSDGYMAIVGSIDRMAPGPYLNSSRYLQGANPYVNEVTADSEPIECVVLVEPKPITNCVNATALSYGNNAFDMQFNGSWGLALRTGKGSNSAGTITTTSQKFNAGLPSWQAKEEKVKFDGVPEFYRPIMAADSDLIEDKKPDEESLYLNFTYEGHYIDVDKESILFNRHATNNTYSTGVSAGKRIHVKSVTIVNNDALTSANPKDLENPANCQIITVRNDEDGNILKP